MSIPHAQGVIAGEVSEWMQRFGATIVLQFSDRLGWHLELNYRGRMLAAIALQLALVVADADSLFTCSGCGMPYIREGRKPAGDRANYCQYCGRDEALRKADKHRREKMAEARRLGAEGVTAAEIAKRLSVRSAATVRRWLKKGK